jgi:hypothetical protein
LPKLRKISNNLENPNPLNPNLPATELLTILPNIQTPLPQIQINNETSKKKKLATHTTDLANTLLLINRSQKDIPIAQRENVNSILLEIIRTKAGDPDFDPKKFLDQNFVVKNANFDIGELSQLAGIWRELGSGSAVSPDRIGKEVDGVLSTLRRGLEQG